MASRTYIFSFVTVSWISFLIEKISSNAIINGAVCQKGGSLGMFELSELSELSVLSVLPCL
jgi:hypothetical protein